MPIGVKNELNKLCANYILECKILVEANKLSRLYITHIYNRLYVYTWVKPKTSPNHHIHCHGCLSTLSKGL